MPDLKCIVMSSSHNTCCFGVELEFFPDPLAKSMKQATFRFLRSGKHLAGFFAAKMLVCFGLSRDDACPHSSLASTRLAAIWSEAMVDER
jgi:hypothetical protein